jgi:DOPA 4,5-dioxygenase
MSDDVMSLENLRRHREAHAEAHESRRVWLFHSHTYFDHEIPEQVAEARAFMELIARTFASTTHVEVHSFVPMPVGPHPRASFEVLFTREAFADYVSWLMFARPPSLSTLIHPLTRLMADDHTTRALWLGEQLGIHRAILDAGDAKTLAAGRSEESVIDGTKRH